MSDESGDKGRRGRPGTREESVLGSLPSTRPNRLGRRREGAAPAVPVKPEAVADVARAAKAERPAAKRAAGPKPPAAKRKAAPSREAGPRPVRAAAPSLGGTAPSDADRPAGPPPSGTELVTTVVQAAGEVARIGLTVGGQILRRAVERLPRP